MKTHITLIVPIVVTVIFALIPVPEGLTQEAWYFLAIFVGVVVGLILEPIPAALIGLSGVSLVAVLGLIDGGAKANRTWALSGFSNGVIWLVFAAFMFAVGYQKTGLGRRISLLMVKYMGKSSLGLGYAVAFSDLVLAPFMPSNTARSAGTLYPVISNIPLIFHSTPTNQPGKLGSYLCWVAIACTCVTSSMFVTALAPNLLAVNLIEKGTGIEISWGNWAMIMVPIMLPLLLLIPYLTYLIYPPTQKKSPEAPKWAKEELGKMGSLSKHEMLMLGFAFLALVGWIFGQQIGINSTMVAVTVVCLLLLFHVISWEDVISNKQAFNVFIWFATLVAMASGLKKMGILQWIGESMGSSLQGMGVISLAITILIVFFILHYFFASVTAHTTALLPIFMVIASQFIPADMLPNFVILVGGSLGVMGILTPYATGPSPIWYGAGYISQSKWWMLGAIYGAIFLAFLLIGLLIFL